MDAAEKFVDRRIVDITLVRLSDEPVVLLEGPRTGEVDRAPQARAATRW